MSNVNALYHIVFSTNQRRMTITDQYREDLYRFIWNIITERKCKLLRIGGIANHLHILLSLNPTVALSDLVREIKAKSSGWLRKDLRFPDFDGWGKEYFAATIAYNDRFSVIEYIKGQKEHHSVKSFREELISFLEAEGIDMTYIKFD